MRSAGPGGRENSDDAFTTSGITKRGKTKQRMNMQHTVPTYAAEPKRASCPHLITGTYGSLDGQSDVFHIRSEFQSPCLMLYLHGVHRIKV